MDLALRPVEVLKFPGGRYLESERKWQGVAGIERTVGGRLWATWYTGGRTEDADNHVVVVTSGDDGETWTEPVLVIDPPGEVRASDPVLWHDPLGRLWLFWMQTAHCGITFDGRGGVWAICASDGERADSDWTSPVRIAHGIMMNKPTVLSTGEWLLPCAVWSHMGPYRHDLPEERFSNVIVSRDNGESFELLGRADVPGRACDEHMIVERRDGSLWMLVRRRDGIGEAMSHDRGRTWVATREVVLPGPCSRFFIRRLRSGRLLLINHHEFSGRNNLTAFLSDDDGHTWPHRLLLDERELVTYPDAVEADGGVIHMIYDRRRVGEGEILLQRFAEADILDGASGGFRHRCPQVISRIRRRCIGGERVVFSDMAMVDQMAGVRAVEGEGSEVWIEPIGEEGDISLPPFRFEGDVLLVDAEVSVGGAILAQIEFSGGVPHGGLSYGECVSVTQGGECVSVQWQGGADPGQVAGQLVRMRFKLRRARIRSFRFAKSAEKSVAVEDTVCCQKS